MNNLNLTWHNGSPVRLEPGILIRYHDGRVSLIGTNFEQSLDRATFGVAVQWARIVETFELEWMADMANRKFGGVK